MRIEKTYDLRFPPARVYAAWVSSQTVIAPATRMEINPTVGGHYRLIMETPDFTTRNNGKFLIVEPNQRVKYSWQWDGDDEVTSIDVQFASSETGTRVSIVHEGFKSQTSFDNHSNGWDSYIDGFNAHLAANRDA